ncbi:carbon-nitrogen hydrolase family protein [Aeromonas diversa]|uniref:carbon-nitrogen hydrolase family protein n=1 Tax=Aeromonas diversa TaxID=502790 RepID=UPI0034633C52
MKIGIVQMRMSWTLDSNFQTISEHVINLENLDILIFPELALTGFHRNIRNELVQHKISQSIEALCELARKHKTTILFGAPTIESTNIYNSYLCINERGKLTAQWHKAGLTPSESHVFKKGMGRKVIKLGKQSVSTFICREVEDVEWFISQMGTHILQYVVWPSYIGRLNGENSLAGYFKNASDIAKNLGALVIQCNWPHSLNAPESKGLGGSKIFDGNGKCIATMPLDTIAVGVLELPTLAFKII